MGKLRPKACNVCSRPKLLPLPHPPQTCPHFLCSREKHLPMSLSIIPFLVRRKYLFRTKRIEPEFGGLRGGWGWETYGTRKGGKTAEG